jgi:putative hydrolase of the HAD superfamily
MRLRSDRVVVFGLDNTLYLEADYQASKLEVISEFAARYFGSAAPNEGQGGDFFDRVLSHVEQMDDAERQDMIECVRQSLPRIRLFADALDVLAGLRDSCLLAVVADGPLSGQQAKCRALELEKLADRIVYPDYWGRPFWSPHPRALMSIQNCYGFEGRQCIYVSAGAESDFDEARRMGWLTIQVQRGQVEAVPPLSTCGPHLQIPTLTPLLGLLNSQKDAA